MPKQAIMAAQMFAVDWSGGSEDRTVLWYVSRFKATRGVNENMITQSTTRCNTALFVGVGWTTTTNNW